MLLELIEKFVIYILPHNAVNIAVEHLSHHLNMVVV